MWQVNKKIVLKGQVTCLPTKIIKIICYEKSLNYYFIPASRNAISSSTKTKCNIYLC